MKIRKAEKSDLKEIVNLWVDFIIEHEERFGREGLKKNYKEGYSKILKNKLKSKKSLVLIAENNLDAMMLIKTELERS